MTNLKDNKTKERLPPVPVYREYPSGLVSHYNCAYCGCSHLYYAQAQSCTHGIFKNNSLKEKWLSWR